MCNFRQDGLKTLALSGFDKLLHSYQKSCVWQREIKPFGGRSAGFYTYLVAMPIGFPSNPSRLSWSGI